MTLQETAEKSMDIRKIYHALEKEIHGKEWTSEEDALAFLTDAALIGRLVMAKEGRWPSSEESMLPSKIGECVQWLAVLAEENGLSVADCVETFLKEKEEFLKQEQMGKRTDTHGFYSDAEKLCKVLGKLSQTVKQDKTHGPDKQKNPSGYSAYTSHSWYT